MNNLEVTKQRVRENTALIRELKKVPCKDCGVQYPPHVMQFDHISGTKKFKLSSPGARKLTTIMTEVNKCEIVCANCHAERTNARLNIPREDMPVDKVPVRKCTVEIPGVKCCRVKSAGIEFRGKYFPGVFVPGIYTGRVSTVGCRHGN